MKFILIQALLLLASVVYTDVADAEENVACFGCDFSTKAREVAEQSVPGTIFTIINTENYTAQSFTTEIVFVGETPSIDEGTFVKAVPIPLTSSGRDSLSLIQSVVSEAERVNLQVPPDLPNTSIDDNLISAHNLIMTPSVRAPLGNFVSSSLDGAHQFAAVFSALLQVFDKIVSINVFVTVRFNDGSTARFKLVGLDVGGVMFEYIEGSAKNSEGQTIPDSASDFLGTFSFANEFNATQFTSIAALFNILVIQSASCSQQIMVNCSTTSDGTVTCTRFVSCN